MRDFKLLVFMVGVVLGVLSLSDFNESAKAESLGEHTVKTVCTTCHRIEGKPAPRRDKEAPDLIWAGNKYQPQWLENWLENPKQRFYPVGYDYNPKRKQTHLALPAKTARAVVEYLTSLRDSRIQEGIMKPGTTEQIQRGKKLYRQHACTNCHWTPANIRRGYTGGKSSTSFLQLGTRLKADWVYRFNQNPNDFVPESGAYIPKPPLPDSDIYAITAYMMTFRK